MTWLVAIKLKCPCCKKRFKTGALASWNNCGRKSTDLHERAHGLQPLPHFIHSCPQCHYTAHEEGFKSRNIDKELRDWVLENLQPHTVGEWVPGQVRYGCAAKIATYKNQSNFVIADLYLKAAWCCDDAGEKEQEKFYRSKAIEYHAKAFEGKEVTQPHLVMSAYLVAENYRRIGNPQEARLWFDRAIEMAEQDPALAECLKLAIQQRDNPKEFFED
jgi:uncharacterized protein